MKNNTTASETTGYTSSVWALNGDSIEIVITPEGGFTPAAVYYGDDEVDKNEDGKYIVTAVKDNTVSVEYDTEDFSLKVDDEITTATITLDSELLGVGEYASGTITPIDGYKVKSIVVAYGSESQTVEVKYNETTGKFSFTMPAGNVTVSAVTEAIPYTVTVDETSLPEKGEYTVTVNRNDEDITPESYFVGETVKIKVTVENGYKMTMTVKDEDGNVLVAPTASKTATFDMPAGNVTVEIAYEGRTYAVEVGTVTYKNEDRDNYAPEGVTLPTVVAPESASAGSEVTISTTMGEKDSVEFTVTSLGVTLPDLDNDERTYTFEMPITAVSIDAVFDVFDQDVYDAQQAYSTAFAAADAIIKAEEPGYSAEAIEALQGVVSANTLSDSDLRSKSAADIQAAATNITNQINSMDLTVELPKLSAKIEQAEAAITAAGSYATTERTALRAAIDAEIDETSLEAVTGKITSIDTAMKALNAKVATEKLEEALG